MIKPRISYVAKTIIPLTLQLNTSIAQCQVDLMTYRNWKNLNELTNFIDSLYVHPDSDTYLYIKCQCKSEFIYRTKAVVPATNVTCKCGRKILIYS